MVQFRLFGIPVGIHWMFPLLMAFLGGATRATTPEDWRYVLLFMLAGLISILVHELGHALTGLKLGAPGVVISLHGFGGAAHFPGGRFSRRDSIIVTAAGPAASIALALVFLLLGRSTTHVAVSSPVLLDFVSTMVFINLFWSVINLCPVLPLDGGQIVRDLLGPARIKLTCVISFTALAVLAVLLWLGTQSIYNLIIMALLGTYTWRVWKGEATQPL